MISQEEIKSFLEGQDPEQYIVSVEFDYASNSIYKIKEPPGGGKIIQKDTFTAFAWVGDLRGLGFYNNSKQTQKEAIDKYGIIINKLRTDGNPRLENGLKFIVKSVKGYRQLQQFFKDGGLNIWDGPAKEKVLMLNPVEQYLVSKEKRLFKGFEEYNDITRLIFDLETTSLEPKDGRIFMIGIKTNKGYHKVIECSNADTERQALIEFFKIIDEIKPTIIAGYNSANFDWFWIFERCKILGVNIKEVCKTLHKNIGITKSDQILKLGNEIERYSQVTMWGYNVIDIIHSVRRAQAINSSIKSAGLKYITKHIQAEAPDRVYIDHDKIGDIYKKNEEYWLNVNNGKYKKADNPEFDNLDKKFPGVYIKTNGVDIVERYLDDDLEETLKVDDEFNQGSFLLASLVPTTYERISTMGTASLWKMLMLAWSYKNGLAIPEKNKKQDFVGGLSRLLTVGYSKDVLKLDYSSLYPSIQLTHDIFPDCDITGVMKGLLSYFRDSRILYKNLASELADTDPKKSKSYDRRQLPIKIFINSMFGALSAPQVFHWGDMDKGEQITCTGRQYLRQMIKFFTKRGYKILVLDTDGCNFSLPQGVESKRYVGKGLNWKVKKDKEYVGYDADVAEFNDTFMSGPMALDCDGTWVSCINLSRKNYATLDGKGKIKLTGNTIKSKKLPLYIEEFLDKGIKQLLEGKGSEFVEYYYEYLQKIYDKKIALSKIAQRAKVKLSIEDYIERSKKTTKSGGAMSRMAHMELAIKHGMNVNLGDVIYYVNNGLKASHGDVQKVPKPNIKESPTSEDMKKFLLKSSDWFEIEGGNWRHKDYMGNLSAFSLEDAYLKAINTEIKLNCYLLDNKMIEENPDMTGDYNVPRAISTFNKRIEPLLIVFGNEIRENLFVDNPENRGIFTKAQCELINGKPFEEGNQDTIEELLTISEMEIKFWDKVNIDPNYIYDFAQEGWEEKVLT